MLLCHVAFRMAPTSRAAVVLSSGASARGGATAAAMRSCRTHLSRSPVLLATDSHAAHAREMELVHACRPMPPDAAMAHGGTCEWKHLGRKQ